MNFVGPTRPTPAPLGDSSFINASNIGQYVDNSRKVVSVEVLDGIHAGDTVRNTYNSLAAGFQNTADHTDSALSAFANQYAASAIRTFGRIEGVITDVVLPPSEPDARIHYSDGKTLTVLGGGPTSGALLGQGLALLPVVLPRGPAIAPQEVTAGPVARTGAETPTIAPSNLRPGSVSGNPANRLVETGTPLKNGQGWVRRWTRMTAEEEQAMADAIANRYNRVLEESYQLPVEQQGAYRFQQMQQYRTEYRQDFLQSRGN